MKQRTATIRRGIQRFREPVVVGSIVILSSIVLVVSAAAISPSKPDANASSVELPLYSLLSPTLESTLCPLRETPENLKPAVTPPLLRKEESASAWTEGYQIQPQEFRYPVHGSGELCPKPVMQG